MPTLQNISLKARQGQKIAIIGDVGAGKSSLLAALLGQIRNVRGEFKVCGSVSYVPQQAWLLNETVRDNILFGLDMNMKRYKEVVRVSSLQRDFTLLLAGDQTELAERGANLSGGQRQRVSLARAVYHDSDIVLLDDPISAVDQHVGRHIFEECFMKFLAKKTVLVAMHQLQYLPQMDWIVCMKGGQIIYQGTYEELMKRADFSDLINSHVAGEEGEADDEPEVLNISDFKLADENAESPTAKRMTSDAQMSVASANMSAGQLSALIERNQQTANAKDFARMTRINELSVYSNSDVKLPEVETTDDEGEDDIEKGKLVKEDTSAATNSYEDFGKYFKAATGTGITAAVCVFFFIVHGVRIGSGMSLIFPFAHY